MSALPGSLSESPNSDQTQGSNEFGLGDFAVFRIFCCLSGYAGFGLFRISYYFITGGHRPHQFDPDFVTSNPRLLPKYHFHSIQCHAVIALTVSKIMFMREGEKVMGLGGLDPLPPPHPPLPLSVVCLYPQERPLLTIVVVTLTVEFLKQQADGKGMTTCIDSFTARSLHEIIHFTATTR
jgi:hypothetical protein